MSKTVNQKSDKIRNCEQNIQKIIEADSKLKEGLEVTGIEGDSIDFYEALDSS